MTTTHIADNLQAKVKLNNGVEMPWLGLGVFKTAEGEEVEHAVRSAIELGYRSIDTAAGYNNESGVGAALRSSGVPREELFITTKLNNPDQGYESALAAFEESRRKLGVEVIDLYLIHWPVKGKYVDSWRALERLYREEKVRAIGVSNFQSHHLEELRKISEVTPAINQVELHPCLAQHELRDYCAGRGIQMQAWSPLMQGRLLDHPVLMTLAQRYGKSTSQVILRWDLQHGIVTIPKSVSAGRIRENSELFDFTLTDDDMAKIDALNENRRIGPDPDNFDF
ncbi:aldo/keto reductase [Paenibacillus sp. 1P07SE]|uniref:aldo/keto reductase n=1 Tax=Paenibacillus sp. 1P07SE TaxID=3132209 RepID=UPI0039A6C0FB